jgi:hypothetical protein
VEKIYKKLPLPDGIKLCMVHNEAVAGVYPLLGAKPKGMMEIFFNKRNSSKIKMYLRAHKQILIPKHLLVEYNGFSFYLGPRHTKIRQRNIDNYKLIQEDVGDSFIISNAHQRNSLPQQSQAIRTDNRSTRSASNEENDIAGQSGDDRNMRPNDEIHNNEPDDDDSDNSSDDDDDESIETEPEWSSRHFNKFLNPQKMSSSEIQSLIHASTTQGLDYVNPIKDHINVNLRGRLSVYSRAFLFRLKVIHMSKLHILI